MAESREERILQILMERLQPLHIEVLNESHMHSGNRRESHFKVLVVSAAFVGKSRIDRQRMINDLMKAEFDGGLHALTQRPLTPEEWEKQKADLEFESPNCKTRRS